MTMRWISRNIVFTSVAVFAVSGCAEGSDPVAPQASGRIEIIEDQAQLAERVVYHESLDLEVDASVVSSSVVGGSGVNASVANANSFSLKLVAEVTPPNVGGIDLEATHVAIYQTRAYVSYGKIGTLARGAVDVFEISDPSRPRLIASVQFKDSDVFTIAADGSNLFCGEGTSDPTFANAAIVEHMKTAGGLGSSSARRDVPGFVATGLAVGGGQLHVAAGDPGGLTTLDAGTLSRIAHDPFPDARAVARSGNWLVALQGRPGRLRVYDPATLAVQSTIALGGLGIGGSKASVDIDGDYAFVSLGDGGMAVVDLAAGQVVASLPRPTMQGVAPGVAVTNAVTVARRFVFLAQGGAGVWVAQSTHLIGQPTLTLVGRIAFPGPVSSNFVVARGSALFVAAGRGGLKIVQIVDDGD